MNMRDAAGRITTRISVSRDITERKRGPGTGAPADAAPARLA